MPRTSLSLLCGIVVSGLASAAPAPEVTEVLGPFVGLDAQLHPDNRQPHPIAYSGTDLGWTYQHGGKIHFLFGDTHAGEKGDPISPVHDDTFGTIDLADWPDPARITRGNVPFIRLGQDQGTSQASGIDPGRSMEQFKTPLGGFSNGTREFGLFITGKPQSCSKDADCSKGYTCDASVGFLRCGARQATRPHAAVQRQRGRLHARHGVRRRQRSRSRQRPLHRSDQHDLGRHAISAVSARTRFTSSSPCVASPIHASTPTSTSGSPTSSPTPRCAPSRTSCPREVRAARNRTIAARAVPAETAACFSGAGRDSSA